MTWISLMFNTRSWFWPFCCIWDLFLQLCIFSVTIQGHNVTAKESESDPSTNVFSQQPHLGVMRHEGPSKTTTKEKICDPISVKSVDKGVILNVQMVSRQRQTCSGLALSLIHICSAVRPRLLRATRLATNLLRKNKVQSVSLWLALLLICVNSVAYDTVQLGASFLLQLEMTFLGCVASSLMMMLKSPVWFTPHWVIAIAKLFLMTWHAPLLWST